MGRQSLGGKEPGNVSTPPIDQYRRSIGKEENKRLKPVVTAIKRNAQIRKQKKQQGNYDNWIIVGSFVLIVLITLFGLYWMASEKFSIVGGGEEF